MTILGYRIRTDIFSRRTVCGQFFTCKVSCNDPNHQFLLHFCINLKVKIFGQNFLKKYFLKKFLEKILKIDFFQFFQKMSRLWKFPSRGQFADRFDHFFMARTDKFWRTGRIFRGQIRGICPPRRTVTNTGCPEIILRTLSRIYDFTKA